MGGINDLLRNQRVSSRSFAKICKISRKTNVFYINVPYMTNNLQLNEQIYNFNMLTYYELGSFVNYVDVNAFLDFKDKTSQGLHYNKHGKEKLFSYISNLLLNLNLVRNGPLGNIINIDCCENISNSCRASLISDVSNCI